MTHDEFIRHVQQRAKLSSRGDAERATRAVLETLAERLAGGEADDVASQLPRGVSAYLQHQWSGIGLRLNRDEFVEAIAQREPCRKPEAAAHARVVFEVLREAISPGEADDIRAQLPPDLRELFDATLSAGL